MPKKLINVSNFSGGLNKNTNSRDMIADEYQVMLNLNNEIPGKLTMYGSSVADAKNVANATAITSINHGNGLFHFNLDRDISTPTVVSNIEYLAINDIVNKKVRIIDYTDSSNSSTDISTDIVYATSGSHEVLMYMADGGLRVVPKPSANNSIYPSILYYQEQIFNFGDLDPDFLVQDFSTFKVHKLHIGGITGGTTITPSYGNRSNNLDPDRLYRQNTVFKPTYGSEFFVDNLMVKTNITASNVSNPNTYNFGRDQMDALFDSIPGNVYQYSSPINVNGRVGAMTMVSYFSNNNNAGLDEDSNITVYKDSDNKRYGLWVAPMYEKNTYEAPAYFMNTIPQPNNSVTTEVKRKLFFGLYGRPPADSRISGYKIYWGLITNYQESSSPQIYDEGSVSAKYCFAEVDFTRGIRYAGEDTYSAFTEDLSKTTTSGTPAVDYKWYNWCFPVDAYDASADHFKGQAFSDLLTIEPYIHKTPSLIGPNGTGFKTVTIANRKAYIGNVKYYDKESNLVEKNDRILKSLPNQFDYFEEDNFIDVEVEDGDDIIKLASLGQRLLEFKKRVLYIINVSRNIEYLEGTYAFKGCEKDYHVYEGEGFIAWINPNGIFFYDGQQLTDISLNESGQSVFSSNSFYDDDHVIGYLPKTKELYIANKDNTILKYDLKSQSWTEGDAFGVVNSSNFTNFILKNDESLSYYQLIQGLNGAADKIELRNWNPTPISFTGANKTILKTKEFDFGNPTANKNINTIYVNYKNGQNITVKGFGTKRDASAVALTDIGSLIDTSGGFRTTKLAVPATFKDLVSFGIALELDGASAADFELNDLQIVYRDKVFRWVL